MLFPKDDQYRLTWIDLRESKNKTDASEVETWMSEFRTNEIFKNKVIELAPQATSGSFENMEQEAIISKITDQPASIMEVIFVDKQLFLSLVAERTRELVAQFDRLKEENRIMQNNVVFDESVFSQYVKTIAKSDFFFNTDEIELTAHLFDKKVQVIAKQEGQYFPTSLEPYNAELPGEPIVIYHEGDHFWRCEPSDTIARVNTLISNMTHQDRVNKYDNSLKELVGEYRDFLLNQIEGVEFPKTRTENIFRSEQFNNSILLPSLNKHQLPLAFPKKLISFIQKNYRLQGLTRSNTDGYFLPSYSFKLNKERRCYELSIEYRLMSHTFDTNPKEYSSFVVAQFGEETVDSFRSPLYEEKDDETFYNEFLIQAMYVTPDHKLKLPGSGSFKVISSIPQTIVPIEDQSNEPFLGLYLRLKEDTRKIITFNNARYESKELEIYGEHIPGFIREFKKDFCLLEKMRSERHATFKETIKNTDEYKTAKKNYLLLENLCKLTLEKGKYNLLLPTSPDHIIQDEITIDRLQEIRGKPNYDPLDAVNAILEVYLKHPSEERKRVSAQLSNHLAIQSHLQNPSEQTKTKLLEICANKKPFSDYGTME